MSGGSVYIRFRGWASIRLPTDPDPADEKRGASGYTFAFGDEPDLDRKIRFQPLNEPEYLRPGAPYDWGVNVFDSFSIDGEGTKRPIPDVATAPVDLLGGPKLENRNWLFTLPGWEPVVPFEIQITLAGQTIQRLAPLTPDHTPVYKVDTPTLMGQGATGVNMEPETVGTATGIWDAVARLKERRATLDQMLAAETDPMKKLILRCRREQVEGGITGPPTDRKVMAHYAVERFFFPVSGTNAIVPSTGPWSGLDPDADWLITYFFAAWDFDTFGAYIQGSLQIPLTT